MFCKDGVGLYIGNTVLGPCDLDKRDLFCSVKQTSSSFIININIFNCKLLLMYFVYWVAS